MAEYTADRLQIEIEGSARKATNSINKQIEALEKLKSVTDGFKNPISDFSFGINNAKAKSTEKALSTMKKSVSDVGKAAKDSSSSVGQLFSSVKRIAFYRLIRTAIKTITDSLKTGVENVYQYSRIIGSDFKNSMDGIASSAIYAKNALGTFAAPILQVLAPSITFLIDKFVDLVNAINEIVAILRGKDTFTKAVKVEAEFAKATDLVSKSTGKAADQMNRFLLGIDEINKTGNPSIEIGKMFEEKEVDLDFAEKVKEATAGIKESLEDTAQSVGDLFKSMWNDVVDVGKSGRLAETLEHIRNIVSGIIDLVGILAERFRIAWETNNVGKHILENLWDILNIILGTIEKAVDITKEWAQGLDFYPLLAGFEKLTAALKPFVELIMNGLLWAYENVLLPVAKWSIEKLFPVMLETAAAAIDLLTASIEWLQPYALWFWENVLKPFAEFTGDAIINAFNDIKSVFEGLASVLRGDTSFNDFFDKLSAGAKMLGIFGTALLIDAAVNGFVKLMGLLGTALTSPTAKLVLVAGALVYVAQLLDQAQAIWDYMTGWQKFFTVVGAGVSIIFALAVALGACQSALTMGIAAVAIVAGIAAIQAAVGAATKNAQAQISAMNAQSANGTASIKPYAAGGFPQSGELFLARESGAELVGNIGGRTGVANNEQIVEGISEGVAYANSGVIGAINQLIAVVQQIDPTVELDGLTVSRQLHRYNKQVNREYGQPLAVEVGV